MTATVRGKLIAVLYVVCALVCLAIFFRHLWVFRLDRASGDIGDSRIVMVLLEHWRDVFLGKRVWTAPIFFYPSPNVLGNTDAYFLYAPSFVLFRALGLDVYLAYEFTLVLIKAIGFASMAWMLRSLFELPHWAALLGAVLFTIFSSSYAHLLHAQLLTIAFIPLVIVGSVNFFRYLDDQPRRALWNGVMAGGVLALVLLTSFYTGWFFVLLVVFASAIFLLMFPREAFASLPTLLALLWRRKLVVAGVAAAFIVFLVPFLILYLPKLRETGGHSFTSLINNSGNLFDIFHLESSNLVWGSLMHRFFGVVYIRRPMTGEIVTGFSPAMIVVFAATLLLTLRAFARTPMMARDFVEHFVIIVGLACVALWLVSVRVDDVSLWWLIYKFFPGGSAMRVPGRLPIFLAIFVIPIVVIGLVWLVEKRSRFGAGLTGAAVVAISAFLVIEQINMSNQAAISRTAEKKVLDPIGPPPAECKVFYVSRAAPREESWNVLRDQLGPNLDGALLAHRFNIPTFNGISTWQPPSWDLYTPGTPQYEKNVGDWMKLNGIQSGVCSLDLASGAWRVRAQ